MKIRSLFVLIVLGLSLSISVAAQKFTSGYTNLGKGCKVLKGGEGQDDASLCKGLGGYQVRIYSSAASTHFVAERAKPEASISIANVSVGFKEGKTLLEWRLANGKPFAVIMRVPIYAEATGEGEYYGKVMGHRLIVVGLAGHEETVKGEVDAKEKGANAKARKMADDAYKAAMAN